MYPRIFIGPMSLNVVDAVVEFNEANPGTVGLIPSRRQIESDGGYVNNWTTVDFVKHVDGRAMIERDHGGPGQGDKDDDGLVSLEVDAKAGFNLLHIDPWKKHQEFHEAVSKTIEAVKHVYSTNSDCEFEIGTEQAIREYSANDLDDFILRVQSGLSVQEWAQVRFAVVQCGTSIVGSRNTGQFDSDKCAAMIAVCKKNDLLSKEHNGDYVSHEDIAKRFVLGLDAINIAPEFGNIETKVYLEHADKSFLDKFYSLCFESKRWVKWFPNDFVPSENKRALVEAAGHYVFSHPDFVSMKDALPGIDEKVQKEVRNRLEALCEAIRQD